MKARRSEIVTDGYKDLLKDVSTMLEAGRRGAARSVNTIMVVTYWHVGRRIVEYEQGGKRRAQYGKELLAKLSVDLSSRFGRGFSKANLESMRRFYSTWSIPQPVAGESVLGSSNQLISRDYRIQQPLAAEIDAPFPLPWSHYVELLPVKNKGARLFYEQEAIRGGWSKRQLIRQIDSQFYERTLLSRNKAAMLKKGTKSCAWGSCLCGGRDQRPFCFRVS